MGHSTNGETELDPFRPLCLNPAGPCILSATNLLGSIHPKSDACMLGGLYGAHQSPTSQGVDKILSLMQQAPQTIRNIVGCSACMSVQIVLLASSICSRIVGLYWDVVDAYTRAPESTSIQRREVQIGQFRLQHNVGSLLMRQALSIMLKDLELAVEEFLNCIGSRDNTAIDTNPVPYELYRRIVTTLRNELHHLRVMLDHQSYESLPRATLQAVA